MRGNQGYGYSSERISGERHQGNVVGNIKPGETATAVVKAGHLGRTVGSATVDILDEKGRLLRQGIGNLHMTKVLADIPAE